MINKKLIKIILLLIFNGIVVPIQNPLSFYQQGEGIINISLMNDINEEPSNGYFLRLRSYKSRLHSAFEILQHSSITSHKQYERNINEVKKVIKDKNFLLSFNELEQQLIHDTIKQAEEDLKNQKNKKNLQKKNTIKNITKIPDQEIILVKNDTPVQSITSVQNNDNKNSNHRSYFSLSQKQKLSLYVLTGLGIVYGGYKLYKKFKKPSQTYLENNLDDVK